MAIRIMTGDVFEQLRLLADDSVDCVVTSPPYWGLRDYGIAGQIGLEKTMAEHIEIMVAVFREVRRVLKPSGTVWLNYGDCYAATPNGRSASDTKRMGNDDRTFRDKPFSTIGPIGPIDRSKNIPRGSGRWGGGLNPAQGYLKAKDLCMIPNRLAIALQDDGWWVRSEIIWAKPNPMPESIIDRPATAHEKIFMLTKSPRYFYNAAAVRTVLADESVRRLSQDIEGQDDSTRANGGRKTNGEMKAKFPSGWQRGEGSHSALDHNSSRARGDKQRGHSRKHAGFNERWDKMTREEQQANGANLKNVWSIPTHGFSEAHFATFPPRIPEICIKAGCPEGGIVLDPFGGSGTTAMVADRLKRDAILIELNPAYVQIAEKRIYDDAPLMVRFTDSSPVPRGGTDRKPIKPRKRKHHDRAKNDRRSPEKTGRASRKPSSRTRGR